MNKIAARLLAATDFWESTKPETSRPLVSESQARWLFEASSRVVRDVRVGNAYRTTETAKPTIEFLMTCESRGGRTVRDVIAGVTYRFELDDHRTKKAIANLTEDPDSIGDQYMRFNYVFELFIGDENGCLVGSFGTHSVMLYTLRKAGAIQQSEEDEDIWELVHENIPKNVKVLGHPQYVKIDYSGVVLPKQEGKKSVDATYISCWTSKSKAIVPLLTAYAKEQYHPPFKLEINTSPDLSSRVFAISDL